MLEGILRRYIQRGCNTLAERTGYIPPIFFTITSLILGWGCAVAIAMHWHYTAVMLLWLSGLCDVLDGTFARVYATASQAGMYADVVADRLVEGGMAVGLAVAYPELEALTTLFAASILYHVTTFMLAGMIMPNTGEKSMHYAWSFIERAEAFLGISSILIFPQYRFILLSLLSTAIFIDATIRCIRVYRYASSYL